MAEAKEGAAVGHGSDTCNNCSTAGIGSFCPICGWCNANRYLVRIGKWPEEETSKGALKLALELKTARPDIFKNFREIISHGLKEEKLTEYLQTEKKFRWAIEASDVYTAGIIHFLNRHNQHVIKPMYIHSINEDGESAQAFFSFAGPDIPEDDNLGASGFEELFAKEFGGEAAVCPGCQAPGVTDLCKICGWYCMQYDACEKPDQKELAAQLEKLTDKKLTRDDPPKLFAPILAQKELKGDALVAYLKKEKKSRFYIRPSSTPGVPALEYLSDANAKVTRQIFVHPGKDGSAAFYSIIGPKAPESPAERIPSLMGIITRSLQADKK